MEDCIGSSVIHLVVRRDTRHGSLQPPIELNAVVALRDRGNPVQARVVVKVGLPGGPSIDAVNPELDLGRALVLIVVDLQAVRPGAELAVGNVLFRRRVMPLVDDEHVVQPDAHAIVDDHVKAVAACVKVPGAIPAGREVGAGNTTPRTRGAKVKVHEVGAFRELWTAIID